MISFVVFIISKSIFLHYFFPQISQQFYVGFNCFILLFQIFIQPILVRLQLLDFLLKGIITGETWPSIFSFWAGRFRARGILPLNDFFIFWHFFIHHFPFDYVDDLLFFANLGDHRLYIPHFLHIHVFKLSNFFFPFIFVVLDLVAKIVNFFFIVFLGFFEGLDQVFKSIYYFWTIIMT